MLLKRNFLRFIATFLVFVLVSVSLISPSYAKSEKEFEITAVNGVEVLANNDQEIRLKTEIEGLVGILVQDKETLKTTFSTYEKAETAPVSLMSIESTDSKQVEHYEVTIDDYSTENGVTVTYEDQKTGQTATISKDDTIIRPMVVILAPLVQIVGAKLIEALLLIAAVVMINNIEFAKTDEIAMNLRNKREYDHYYAKIMQGDVWIGPAISLSTAVNRLKSFNGDSDVTGRDVWSTTLSGAAKVAQRAGGGKEPVGPEISKPGLGFGYYYHYHIWDRSGGHSFF
ncbi:MULTISPECIES: hypothetical protein [Paenibacillus]|uniref:Uncharacterized protein n=1 Tax=Paenibacillus cucumis (ex Kampfer et al. 2016) TaxID=1776858 RepID=A0ABS7KQD8_9BACL|nr:MULTISPECIES: hypothetical protein [Paenibacillus]MBY0206393.1 hypothetical protein [Paenibacillus cucumis (ex Kampfer et al. 2016)]MCM3135064.1 hypothetical protein [Paenibacillus polysaccharolyticus]MDP9700842.1 hypothetical protein [Paenibacillus intestini]